MEFIFKRVKFSSKIPDKATFQAYLINDSWDDYRYKTTYELVVFDQDGTRHNMGPIKIGMFGQKIGPKPDLPVKFIALDKAFFSLGQGVDYYKKIQSFDSELKFTLLRGLNDIVNDEKLLEKAIKEGVTQTSLFRSVNLLTIKRQFKRILDGGAILTNYQFQYTFPKVKTPNVPVIEFEVRPESNPPTNIHVIIGRNGVGKTYLLNNIVQAIFKKENDANVYGDFYFTQNNYSSAMYKDAFAGVVSVAFSAFDPFRSYSEHEANYGDMRYSYVGIKKQINGDRNVLMTTDMLADEYGDSVSVCFAHGKEERWKNSLKTLESDPLFKEAGLGELFNVVTEEEDWIEDAKKQFKKLSSGHGIVLLTMTKLIEKVEEGTLVLMDEPEGHLHPPLLSAFVRAISDLLIQLNGVAIIATHSPVVLQEVPKSCIWKLNRAGWSVQASRPECETFGENVGVLTREIFGLEVTESGYHQLLNKELATGASYESILETFNGQLGTEAKGVLRGLLADRDKSIGL